MLGTIPAGNGLYSFRCASDRSPLSSATDHRDEPEPSLRSDLPPSQIADSADTEGIKAAADVASHSCIDDQQARPLMNQHYDQLIVKRTSRTTAVFDLT